MNLVTMLLAHAEAVARDAEKDYQDTLKICQAECKHEDVVEHPDSHGKFIVSPPYRVCRTCGYAEEGWGCGYWKLAPRVFEVPHLSREAAWKFVRGKIWTQDEMSYVLGRHPKPR